MLTSEPARTYFMPLLRSALLLLALLTPVSGAQNREAPTSPSAPSTASPATTGAPPSGEAWTPTPLAPFVATYQAFYKSREAGDATLTVSHDTDSTQWRVDMSVRGRKGFASVLGLNLEQSTVFRNDGATYVPLTQGTTRKAILFGRKVTGVYDWQTRTAQWQGDLKKERRQAIALQPGDQSALLLNLSLMRDARPGRSLTYRYVDLGRVRHYDYRAADTPETVAVGDLSYSALRVYRSNGGDNETILWIANGVPTPVRILQREKGQDQLDLRLIDYQGV